MSRLRGLAVVCVVVGMLAPMALGADEIAKPEAATVKGNFSISFGIALIGTCLAAAACAIGGGLAIARIGSACIESIARQPEAAASMFAPMIVSAAMIEGGMLFAIVVALLGVLKLSA